MTWADAVTALAGVGTLVVAVVGVFLALATYRQKVADDKRGRWWERARWAVEQAQDSDEKKSVVGLAVLGAMLDSDLASAEEDALMLAITDVLLGAAEPSTTHEVYLVDSEEGGGDG